MSGKKRASKPSRPPAKLMKQLATRGPYRVLRGNLGIVGIPGQVFTPAEGTRRAAIAFGHDWLVDSRRYRDLLYHFASWGFVVVAPDTQTGAVPSDVGFAADLRSALSIVSHYPLGTGQVTVDPDRTGLVGHGFGAAAAVIAAGDRPLLGQEPAAVAGLVGLFPAPTTPMLPAAAGTVTAPGLLLAGSEEIDNVDANALSLAGDYGGDVVLRTIPQASRRGLLERRTPKSLLGMNGADKKTHTAVRAITTGFLLHTLDGDAEYAAFADPDEILGKTTVIDVDEPPEQPLGQVSRLLGAKPRTRARKLLQKTPVR
ncbi:dienelactone hydrolase family protein [Gordonia sp. NPDC003429]